ADPARQTVILFGHAEYFAEVESVHQVLLVRDVVDEHRRLPALVGRLVTQAGVADGIAALRAGRRTGQTEEVFRAILEVALHSQVALPEWPLVTQQAVDVPLR